jgi:glutathione S-transferase
LLHAAPYLLFAQHLGASFDAYPKIQEYLKAVKARTAVAQVLKLHEDAQTYGNRDYFSGVI